MIIYKVLFPFLIFVTSELAEKVYDPCSEFLNYFGTPLVRCQSEKQDYEYLECYDLEDKEYFEKMDTPLTYWCWSRHDNNDDELKNLTISANAGGHDYDNSEVNDIINRPFIGRFYVNETHITCHDNEEWSETIDRDYIFIYCPISTGYYMAAFSYYGYGYKKLHL